MVWKAVAAGSLLGALLWGAEKLGLQAAVYSGLGGGLLLGLAGYVFSVRIAARHRQAAKRKDGRGDIWALWGMGLLARLLLLGILSGVFWRVLRQDFPAAMLSLGVCYLGLLLWETAWLYRVLIDESGTREALSSDG